MSCDRKQPSTKEGWGLPIIYGSRKQPSARDCRHLWPEAVKVAQLPSKLQSFGSVLACAGTFSVSAHRN
jgi:hypothetical protein